MQYEIIFHETEIVGTSFCAPVFTACQRRCRKVMFSVVSVCSQGVPVWPLPVVPLVSHRSHGDPPVPPHPSTWDPSSQSWSCPLPTWGPHHTRSLNPYTPDMFTLVQLGPHHTVIPSPSPLPPLGSVRKKWHYGLQE